jgi:zinc transporter, ZIP family
MDDAARVEPSEVNESGGIGWRLWALVPVVLLAAVVSGFVASGSSLVDLIGRNPPQADEFDIRRVELKRGEIRIRVTNPQQDALTIGSVTVDDAIVPYSVEGGSTLKRLRSSTIVVPYDWVPDEPLSVGVTSSTGIETAKAIPAAVETPGVSASGFLGYGIIGFLVGVVPVALGLLWLPSLRRADERWLGAFMALTAGLLTFLGVEALFEAVDRQAVLPSAIGGVGLVVLGVAFSFLALTALSRRLQSSAPAPAKPAPPLLGGSVEPAPLGEGSGAAAGLALATLVAVGIGFHNFGEGLAIGTSFAFGELTLGSFLIVGFMIHNVTEGLGIAAPAAEGRGQVRLRRLVALALIAGAPAILGAWLGGFLASDFLGVLFFAAAAGAAFEVVVEVGRYVARRVPGGLTSVPAMGGFLAGLAVMYLTGLLAG